MSEALDTDPVAMPRPFTDTEPAPPMPFGADPERKTARVELPDGWDSGAGTITNIWHGGVTGSVGIIRSHAGAYRASHHHQRDGHLLHVLEGEVRYYERAIGATKVELEEVFGPDDTFVTPPGYEHLMIFTAPTVMVSLSSLPRTHDAHEADVVRVPRESWDV